MTLEPTGHALPALYAVLLWWFLTGAILYLDGRPRHTFPRSLGAATGLAALAVVGLGVTRASTGPIGAYAAFTCAVLLWGWNEMAFLMGFVTGPRKEACEASCRGWRHVGHAVAAVLYHEIGLLVSTALVVAIAWGEPNPVGAWTFLVLWSMRISTKLNVFLGVPNLSESFLPDHLRYLERYFTRKPMNLLFPVSVTGATLLTAYFVSEAIAAEGGAFGVVGATLLATLAGLALLEHWFLVLPLPVERLWAWGLRGRTTEPETTGSEARARLVTPPAEL